MVELIGWFVILLLVLAAAVVVDHDIGWIPTGGLILGLIGCFFIYGFKEVLLFLVFNFHFLLAGAAIWIMVGLFWAVHVKWRQRVVKLREKWEEARADYPQITYDRPDWKEYKDTIAVWVVYWPLSMLGTVLGDFIWDGVMRLVKLAGKTMDRITDSVFNGFVYEPPKKEPETKADPVAGRYR